MLRETVPTRYLFSFYSLILSFFLVFFFSLFLSLFFFTLSYSSREKIHAKNRRAAKQEEAQSESLPENDGHTENVPLSGTSDSRTQIRVRHLLLLLFRHYRHQLLPFLLLLSSLPSLLLLRPHFCTYSRNIAWREFIRRDPRYPRENDEGRAEKIRSNEREKRATSPRGCLYEFAIYQVAVDKNVVGERVARR